VQARRSGGDTVLGDIVRMVEDAQTREAPVQRLADKVSNQINKRFLWHSLHSFC
jgi:Cu2+-exporting ATPase